MNPENKWSHLPIAIAALVDALLDIFGCYVFSHGLDMTSYRWIWYPVYYLEWTILCYGALTLVGSKQIWSSWIAPYAIYECYKSTRKYSSRFDNSTVKDFDKFAWIFLIGYITLTFCDLLCGNIRLFDDIFMVCASTLTVITSIMLLDMQQKKYIALLESKVSHDNIAEEDSLDSRVKAWENDPSKPFCKENLSLVAVADEIKVNPRVLSAYINSIRKCTFNSWINNLRVKEIISIIKEDKDCCTMEIIDRTGFQSQSSMSRVIKQITGKTLTDLRLAS